MKNLIRNILIRLGLFALLFVLAFASLVAPRWVAIAFAKSDPRRFFSGGVRARYIVEEGSVTGHCCFSASVMDTVVPRKGSMGVLCECFSTADALRVAAALNAPTKDWTERKTEVLAHLETRAAAVGLNFAFDGRRFRLTQKESTVFFDRPEEVHTFLSGVKFAAQQEMRG